jgi:L-lactate dehydrogenase (cytochrome)
VEAGRWIDQWIDQAGHLGPPARVDDVRVHRGSERLEVVDDEVAEQPVAVQIGRIVARTGGADAIIISNHGGRQLDRAPTPFEQLPGIAKAVGDRAEVYVDGGILNGGDIIAAVALGARAAFVGRAYPYGLMAGGERGVERAGELLRRETIRTLQLLGVARVADLDPGRVRLRDH